MDGTIWLQAELLSASWFFSVNHYQHQQRCNSSRASAYCCSTQVGSHHCGHYSTRDVYDLTCYFCCVFTTTSHLSALISLKHCQLSSTYFSFSCIQLTSLTFYIEISSHIISATLSSDCTRVYNIWSLITFSTYARNLISDELPWCMSVTEDL